MNQAAARCKSTERQPTAPDLDAGQGSLKFANMKTVAKLTIITALMMSGLAGCSIVRGDAEMPSTPEANAQQEASNAKTQPQPEAPTLNPYSPYGVAVHAHSEYDVVTFKDVGLTGLSAHREAVLESIADSLAMNMSLDPRRPYDAHFVHDEYFSDPNSHVYCDMKHIYVDVWTGSHPDRVGYSLWSGCGEDDQFAWEEVPVEFSASKEFQPVVDVLTSSIADKLREADAQGCYTKTC